MKNDVDWRHIVAAVLVVAGIVYGGFRIMTAKPEEPNAKVVAGPNARMEDAPEHAAPVVGAPQGRGQTGSPPPGVTAQ